MIQHQSPSFNACTCKKVCTNACGCRKAGLHCSLLCKHCIGQSCENPMPVILDNESEDGDAPAPIDMVDEQVECEDIALKKSHGVRSGDLGGMATKEHHPDQRALSSDVAVLCGESRGKLQECTLNARNRRTLRIFQHTKAIFLHWRHLVDCRYRPAI
ncbi:hypothetical protein AVEN_271422-1 [Araneus ventricosus]|uniref:Tesmin/TSO1-like CXC domain-containing protein n=1 Tax=Araneus ventricosus TaxID=182803 RepID=A0A4Y2H8I2_ARAVE|nr:hypothetical protein AVEN_271422-1 [Araneus ventricosus]